MKRGDYDTALRLLGPLANQGDVIAQNNLGFMYFNGQGVPQNHDEAAKWFWLAANRGVASAQALLGLGWSARRRRPGWLVLRHALANVVLADEKAAARQRSRPCRMQR